MTDTIISLVSKGAGLPAQAVAGCVRLLQEGNTVPFIARYRKEATGNLDEVGIRKVKEVLEEVEAFLDRKQTILATLEKAGLLTEELRASIEACQERTTLEDLYLPYKPRRATRADKAREAGLAPLALTMLGLDGGLPEGRAPVAQAQWASRRLEIASRFVAAEKGVGSVDDALAGARDIVAEMLSTQPETRAAVREMANRSGVLASKKKRGAGDQAEPFRDYFDHKESASRAAAHRILAMLRGEEAGALSVGIEMEDERGIGAMLSPFRGKVPGFFRVDVQDAAADGWSRLLWPAVEREVLAVLKRRADVASVTVFENNLRSVLMEPPTRGRRVLGFDPGYRHGCKMAVVDETGKLLSWATVYPHEPQRQGREAESTLMRICDQTRFNVVAVGDGTAHRESMAFLSSLSWPHPVEIVAVSEAGASVYSASPLAGQEFPELDVSIRGAVSIARRYQDPLAELVKIEPKALGLGQYQHDVDQKLLESGLDAVVEECVNRVGVDLNTASAPLLQRVAGLGASSAQAVVTLREQKGAFKERAALLKVAGIGAARFQQCAGFVRVRGGKEPLDATGIHPERYEYVHALAVAADVNLADVLGDAERVRPLRAIAGTRAWQREGLGQATLDDIFRELERPGHDPRGERQEFSFAEGISSIEHLKPGMVLPGRVTNVTDFGAFVDVGVHRDGLVHISQLSERRVASAFEVVQPRQIVTVMVVEVDLKRGRISLTMRGV